MEGVIPNTEELVRNLKHQLSLYKQLIDVLRDERINIVEVKYKELRESTFAKEAIIDEIQREDYRRHLWLKDAAKALQVSDKEVTLELFASKFARDQYESLMSLRNTLLVFLRKSKDLNEDNKKLVEAALRDTQELKKNILGFTSDQPKVYGPKGSMNQKENTSRILNKEA